jgi:Spy/CpxP family protein refolding chaperone
MSIDKIRKSILILAAAGAIALGGLFAGRLSARVFRQEQEHAHGDFAPRLFAQVSQALDLTDDQKAKVKDILRSHSDEIKAQMRSWGTARRALREAMMTLPVDENAIRAAADQVGQSQANGALLLARIRGEIDPILTPDQKERLQKFQSRTGHHTERAVQSFDNFLKGSS